MLRRPILRVTVSLAAGAGFALLQVTPTPAGAVVRAPHLAATAAWGVVPSPNRGNLDNELKGLATVSATDAWAVGEYNPGVPPTVTGRRTLIEHFDGSSWTLAPSPNPSWSGMDLATLEDVDAVSATDVWAVGYSEDFASLRLNTLVEHWDGARWSIVPSPNPAGKNQPNQLFGVAVVTSDDVWAVGQRDLGGRALILHWDGTAWSAVTNPCGRYALLRGVSALSATDVWAVGDATTCHFDGTAWTLVPSPQPRSRFSEDAYPLESVSAAATDDVWAVGSRAIDNGYYVEFQSFAEHWDGTRWTPTYALPGATLSDVEAVSPTEAWTVGTYSAGTLVVEWDGARWNAVPTPDPGDGGLVNALDTDGSTGYLAAGASFAQGSEQTLVLQAPSTTQGSIEGDTGVSGATVTWLGPSNGSAVTDVFGHYDGAGLIPGRYVVTATAQGCDPGVAQVTVVAGTTVIADVHPQC